MRKECIIVITLLLMSCSVGPDYHKPTLYSDDSLRKSIGLKANSSTQISRDWYTQFNDSILNRLIDYALSHSPNVNISVQRLREARSNWRISRVNNLPMFNADGNYNYNKTSRALGYTISPDYYQSGLDATWELDIWGGGRRQSENALALAEAAASSLRNVQVSLTAEVATNYIMLRTMQEQIRIARQNLQLQEDIFATISAKRQYGLADEVSYKQAEYTVENTRSQIPELQKQAEVYANSLTILLGKLPHSLDNMLQPKKNNLIRRRFDYDLQQLYDLPISLVRERPDVRIAEHKLHADNALVGAAIAELYPNFSLSGFIGWQAPEISGLVSRDSYGYSYTPAIKLPIFHWGQLQNRIEQQKASTLASFFSYQNAVLNAVAEVKNSIVSVHEEYQKNKSSYKAAQAQKIASELMLEKYKNGLVEFSDVMISQQQRLNAQEQLVASNSQIYLDLIAFYKSIGGGYSY